MADIFFYFYFESDPLFRQRGSRPNQIQHAPDPYMQIVLLSSGSAHLFDTLTQLLVVCPFI